MEQYLIFLGNAFTKVKGEQFKFLYFLVMTMSSEEADALEISIGYIMDVMGKSERTVRKLIGELVEMGYITFENGLFSLRIEENITQYDEEYENADIQEEKPRKRVGFV